MNDKPTDPASGYRPSPAMSLREACRKAGCDDDGNRCFACPVRDLCESDERWLVVWRVR